MILKFLKRYRHVNWVLADQAIVSGVNFLTGLLIARFLGIQEFGVFTLVWMAVLFVNSIQMAAISAPMMTIGPKQVEEEHASYYGAVIIQQLIFSILTSFLLWIGMTYSYLVNAQWQITHLALPLATSLFFSQNQDFLRRVLFTNNLPLLVLISDVISYLVRAILLFLFFVYATLSTSHVLYIIAICAALGLIVGFSFISTIVFKPKLIIPVFKRHWILSKWMIASAIMQWSSSNYFIVAAGTLLGPVAVGALKAAQNIIAITHILFQGLENIVPATASRHFISNSVSGLKQYLLKVSFWGGGATAILAIAVSLSPGIVLNLIYGEQYKDFGNVLRWYSACYVIMFFNLPLRVGLRVLDTSRPIFIAYVLMTIFAVLSAKKIIEYWGVEGVAIGLLLTQTIMLCCLSYNFRRLVALGRFVKRGELN